MGNEFATNLHFFTKTRQQISKIWPLNGPNGGLWKVGLPLLAILALLAKFIGDDACISFRKVSVIFLAVSAFLCTFAAITNKNSDMKRIILAILTLCAALTAAADTKAGFSSVVITTQTGETTTVTLTDDMTTAFTATDIVFADADNVVSIPLARLRSYTFVEATIPEGISAPTAGISTRQAAEVYTIDGRLITTTRSLNLEGLQPGTYIVRSGQESVKIQHR